MGEKDVEEMLFYKYKHPACVPSLYAISQFGSTTTGKVQEGTSSQKGSFRPVLN